MKKTMADMVGDKALMIFSDILSWEINVKTPEEERTFYCEAYRGAERQGCNIHTDAEYKNFPEKVYQVFVDNEHIGETPKKIEIREIAKNHVRKLYEDKRKNEKG